LHSAHVLPVFVFTLSGRLKPEGVVSIAATTTCRVSSTGFRNSRRLSFEASTDRVR
jgi:hypothetical protein